MIVAGNTVTPLNMGALKNFFEELPEKAIQLGTRVLLAALFFLIGVQIIKMLRKVLKKALKKGNADLGVIQFLDSFTKVALYIILVFMIASGFGLDATSVVALIGSAGVAIGLALQGSLSNFAGGVLILLLKPFKVGDYIIEDNKGNEGTVSEIQLFYTKLKTADDKIIILPNGTLANTSLTNVTATKQRRLDIKVGISYDADIKLAKEKLMQMLKADETVMKEMDYSVFVDELGDNAVILNVRGWTLNEDYWTAKGRLTEQIKEILDENGIGIPFPQVDVHMIEK